MPTEVSKDVTVLRMTNNMKTPNVQSTNILRKYLEN